jgi:ankyrin repeat protein
LPPIAATSADAAAPGIGRRSSTAEPQHHTLDGCGRRGTNEPQEEAGEESRRWKLKLLLDLGADVNTVDKNGDTAMHGAAYNISPLVVKLLAQWGRSANLEEPNRAGGTPLFIAEGYISRLLRSGCTNHRGH